MNKTKTKYIEAYIYAKTLNQITKHTPHNNINLSLNNNILRGEKLSNELLEICEEKIKNLKLDDLSFLVLKKELEKPTTYENSFSVNYKKICEMLTDYDNYLNIVTS